MMIDPPDLNYQVTHVTRYAYSEQVPVCHNLVHLAPRELPYQRCAKYQPTVNPEPLSITERDDYCGNRVEYFSIHDPHAAMTVSANSHLVLSPRPVVEPRKSPPWESVVQQVAEDCSYSGLDARQYLFASPYTRLERRFADYARESFGVGRPVWEAALELTARLHKDFRYDPRSTTVHSSLDEVMAQRSGVCQDFAHLQIACLRSLGLPARYVSGYLRTLAPPGKPRLIGVDASHAWLSLYGGPQCGWVDFDPTNNQIPGTDYLTVAWGRDYADVCPIQGVVIGGGLHTMSVSVNVELLP